MTNLPSPADLLAEAIDLARKITASDADLVRARLLLDIASEMRSAADARRMWPGISAPRPASGRPADLRFPPHPDFRRRAVVGSGDLTDMTDPEPAAGAVDVTQILDGIEWREGDISECRFCHTPVMLGEATIAQQTYGNGGADVVWRHKYSGQAACAVAAMGEQMAGDETLVHTFATPATNLKALASGGVIKRPGMYRSGEE